jgi:hypothetical protein
MTRLRGVLPVGRAGEGQAAEPETPAWPSPARPQTRKALKGMENVVNPHPHGYRVQWRRREHGVAIRALETAIIVLEQGG